MADQIAEYKKFVGEVTARLALPAIENYYPIADQLLTKHSGIQITGTFETDDDTTEGRLSYVTVLRDSEALDPANGYGFAWMKGDGTMFNVYLVDNSPLANDLFISNNFIVNSNGENTWKAAAKATILINTVYNFKLVIGEDYAMSLKIWASGDSEPVTNLAQIGAPNANLAAAGDRFGIGVMGTNNSQWWYDDIVINTSFGIHTAVLFRLRARSTDFPTYSKARVYFYGYGADGEDPSKIWGATAFMRVYTNSNWNWLEIGTNTATNTTDRARSEISKEFTVDSSTVSSDGFVDLLLTTTSATNTVTDLTAYYVSLESLMPSGIHAGGCADIYINDPSKIVVAEQTINNITGTVELSTANGFLGPLHSIVDVQIAVVGDSFVRNQDWILVSGNTSKAYSTHENPYIVFSPELSNYKVKVIYRYYQTGVAIQGLLESDTYRYSGTSNIQKIMPPVIVRFNNVTFRGSISDVNIRNILKNYVNGLTSSTISRTEIINLLYRYGVTYLDLSTLNIGIITADYLRVTEDEVELVSTYTLPALTAFYTDSYEMDGITRQ